MFVNWDGWEEPVTQRLIFVRANHAKMEAYVQTMTMPTFASVPMGTAAITVNITEKFVIETLVNMVVLVSVAQVDTMAIPVYAHLEQQETTARRTLEMSVPTAPVKMELNVSIELEILIVTVQQSLEAKIVKSMTKHPLVVSIEQKDGTKLSI